MSPASLWRAGEPPQRIISRLSPSRDPSSCRDYRLNLTLLRSPPAEDERSFLIDPSLEFRASSFDGAPSFTWADLSSSLASSIHAPSSPSSSPRLGPASGSGSPTVDDDTDLFEFITDAGQVSAADCARFDEVVRRCMFERKFGRSSADASREELESLKWTEPVRAYPKLPSLASTTKPGPAKPAPAAPAAGADDPAEQLERELAGLTVHQTDDQPGQTTVAAAAAADDGAPSTAASGPQVKAIIPPSADAAAAPEEALSEELPVIFSGQAEIYLFDPETEYFVVQGKVRVLVIEKNDRPFDCASCPPLAPHTPPSVSGADPRAWLSGLCCRLVRVPARGDGRVHHRPADRGRHEHALVAGGARLYVELQCGPVVSASVPSLFRPPC